MNIKHIAITLLSIPFLLASMQNTGMEIEGILIPHDILSEWISWAADSSADATRAKLELRQEKKREANLEEQEFEKENNNGRFFTQLTTDASWCGLGSFTWGEKKQKEHFFTMCRQLYTCSLVCRTWHHAAQLPLRMRNYMLTHKDNLSKLLRGFIIDTSHLLADEVIQKNYTILSTLLAYNILDLTILTDCMDYTPEVKQHPHHERIWPARAWTEHINKPTLWTLLHYAAYAANPDVLELLLATNTIPIDTTDNAGATPLHIACNLIEEEDECQFNKNSSDNEEEEFESLDVRTKRFHLKSVCTLLNHGANPNIEDNNEHTPADYTNNTEIRGLFKQYIV